MNGPQGFECSIAFSHPAGSPHAKSIVAFSGRGENFGLALNDALTRAGLSNQNLVMMLAEMLSQRTASDTGDDHANRLADDMVKAALKLLAHHTAPPQP